jgi:thiamine biosynthesis lipoprotein
VLFEERFRAMNTDIDVIIDAPRRPSAEFISVRLLFGQQEQRFSRFLPATLITRLNSGEAVDDPWLGKLVRLALEAHEATGGLFNPMVLPALAEAGYASSFESVQGGSPRAQAVPDPRRAVLLRGDRVRLREGQFDGGGIVKGWTVDLAVALLLEAADGALVNAGGDMRGEGHGDRGGGWAAAIEAPEAGSLAWHGTLHGALATSTTRKRQWRTASGGHAHHLIDPRTGMPADSPFSQASCWAPEARIAETWAKAVLIGGHDGLRAAASAGIPALALGAGGEALGNGLAWGQGKF